MAKKPNDPGQLRGWRNGPTKSEFDAWSEDRKKEFFSFLYEPAPTNEDMLIMFENLGFRREDQKPRSDVA
jgi:hypothetical protein